jgi:hypothetical protein
MSEEKNKINHICEKSIFEKGAAVYGKLSSKDCFQAEKAKIKNLVSLEIDVKEITAENISVKNSLTVGGNTILDILSVNNVEIESNLNVGKNLNTENLHAQTGTIEKLNNETLTSSAIVADILDVNENALIKGDLTVEGNIVSICSDLNKYYPPPPSDEIYDQNQFITLSPTVPVNLTTIMEYKKNLSFPISERIAGVFGYNSDGSISLTNGKLYNDQVVNINYQINSVPLKSVQVFSPIDIEGYLPIMSQWYSERGFQIPSPDTFPSNQSQFNFMDINGSYSINMNFIYGSNAFIPIFVDIIALIPFAGASPVYEPDEQKRNKLFAYPYRISITQDCQIFKSKDENNEPIVYYEEITQQLKISFKNQNFLSFDRFFANANGTMTRVQQYMIDFSGRFQLMKRSRSNELIASSFNNADVIAQISDSVNLISRRSINQSINNTFSTIFKYRTNGFYTGMILPLINGGSGSLDIYNIVNGSTNGFVTSITPLITLERRIGENIYPIGDNANTILVEKNSSICSTWIFKEKGGLSDVYLTEEFLNNPLIPEQVSYFPPALGLEGIRNTSIILPHEFFHFIQRSVTISNLIDSEAQAVGIESEPSLNLGTFSVGRTFLFADFLRNFYIGRWPLMSTNNISTFRSYGEGIWWRWISKIYDPNYQILRRSIDIMNINYGNITIDYNIPFADTYGGGIRLACKQAVKELYNLELSEIFANFCISVSLLRNNSSIDCTYRSVFPFWLQQPLYPYALETAGNIQSVAYWWNDLDKNNINSIIPTWPRTNGAFNLEDLSCRIFVVNPNIISTLKFTNVDTQNPNAPKYGNIYVAVHQYKANDNTGLFKIQGPIKLEGNQSHTFNISDFSNGGLIRFVAINSSITDFGGTEGINNLFRSLIPNKTTGRIEVIST